MKKISYIVLLLSLLSFMSCDQLDLQPTDQPSSGTFWVKSDDFKIALTAVYGTMQRNFYSFSTPNWDSMTDNSYGQHAEGQYGLTTQIAMGNINPSSGGFIDGIYLGAFSDIARINIFIDKLEQFTEIDDATKKEYLAEARMCRAFYYSYLYRCYDEVPIVSEPLTLETQYQEKKPASQVYEFLMDDIDFAIKNLPNVTYKENGGRWTKNAANAYKARMVLYTSYDDAGNPIPAKMEEAKTLLTGITGYELSTDFSDNFNDLKQEDSPEIMMSIKFLAPNSYNRSDLWYADWMVLTPLVNFIEEFEMKDGTEGAPVPMQAGSKFAVDTDVFTNESLADRDSRLAKTVFIEKYVVSGEEFTPSNNNPTKTGMSKFLSTNLTPPFTWSTLSQQDWVVVRYAEVLLMLAEVENELNGPTTLVHNSINAIRTRSFMPDLDSNLTQDEMREKIRHERRVELAFEGHRYFDLKRWKTAETVLNNVTDSPVIYNFEKKHYLWPLPQSEIDKNNGVLVQNPNYK